MRYLIDTNICIYILNKKPRNVIQKFKQIPVGEICVSTITIAELQYGTAKSSNKEKNYQRLKEFMIPFKILPFSEKSTQFYGELRYQLEKSGETIGPFDLLIAADALSNNLILVSNNLREFKRVKGLPLENWLE